MTEKPMQIRWTEYEWHSIVEITIEQICDPERSRLTVSCSRYHVAIDDTGVVRQVPWHEHSPSSADAGMESYQRHTYLTSDMLSKQTATISIRSYTTAYPPNERSGIFPAQAKHVEISCYMPYSREVWEEPYIINRILSVFKPVTQHAVEDLLSGSRQLIADADNTEASE